MNDEPMTDKSKSDDIQKKILLCLNYVHSSTKNKLLNNYLRQDIEEFEKLYGEFSSPDQFYEKNEYMRDAYEELKRIKNIEIEKEKMTIVCPICGSNDVSVKYNQLRSGDEEESIQIKCNFCGGLSTDF